MEGQFCVAGCMCRFGEHAKYVLVSQHHELIHMTRLVLDILASFVSNCLSDWKAEIANPRAIMLQLITCSNEYLLSKCQRLLGEVYPGVALQTLRLGIWMVQIGPRSVQTPAKELIADRGWPFHIEWRILNPRRLKRPSAV